ncbi:MAG: energy transducer TonB [Acidobacteria bacterium]|nr:energy transducer TonB [Acidobacteriota bacterium]
MFEDSLLEYGDRMKTKKPMTVVLSFVLQCIIVAILVLIPLIYTEALPRRELMTFLMAPPPPPPPPPPPAPAPKVVVRKIVQRPQEMVQPKAIPKQVAIIQEDPLPPPGPVGGVVGGIDGGFAGGGAGGVLGGIIAAPPPPPPPPPPERVRVGGQVQSAKLVNQARPVYPPLARQARIQGTVRLEAVINKQGQIEELTVVSGHPMLIQAALDAVAKWQYEPTMLNGVPVEVITTIDVNFTMGR